MADQSDSLTSALHAIARFLLSDEDFDQTARRVADLALEAFPAADFVGLSLLVDGAVVTAAWTDPFVLEIDADQHSAGEGPCLDAMDTRHVFQVDVTGEDERWPLFGPRAAAKGISSVLSLPLAIDGTVGTLNLYARLGGAFRDTDHHLGELFGAQVGVALHNARIFFQRARLADQLNEALLSRAVIDQAKGILMEREGVSADEAFEMLRAISRDQNVKLREVSLLLVRSVDRSGP
jgi:GAF domain-containing protein